MGRPPCGARSLQQKEQFVKAVTGKLLMYAVGREMEYHDAPAIRAIVRAARRRLPLVVDDSGDRRRARRSRCDAPSSDTEGRGS